MKYGIIAFVLFFSFAASAQQQWSVASQFSKQSTPIPYFLNENYGFTILVGSDSTLLRTVDGGKHWIKAGIAYIDIAHPQAVTITKLFFDTPGHIFGTGQYSGVFESNDSGMTWTGNDIYQAQNVYFSKGVLCTGNGYLSIDSGKTFLLANSAIQYGASFVFGNKDNGIAFLNGTSNGGKNLTAYTTDNGYSWLISKVKDQGVAGYAIPYTFMYFALASVSNRYSDSLIRSPDGGATWKKIYPSGQSKFYPLAPEIAGSGNILYGEQIYDPNPNYGISSIGVILSKDLGITWDTIAGPHAFVHSHLSAVARGAVCFASDNSGRIWKFVDSSLLRNATNDLTIEKNSNALLHDTLFTRTCDSLKLNLQYGFTGKDYVKLDGISVEGIPVSDYQTDFVKGQVLMLSRGDTSSITFRPSVPGTYSIKVHTYLLRDDWVVEDTAFNLVLVVSPKSGIVSISAKDTIDFGRQILCTAKTVTDSFFISNTGCDDIQIQSVRLEVGQNIKSDFTIAAITPFVLSKIDAPKKFIINFKPSSALIESAQIIIVANTGSDTVKLRGEGIRDDRSLFYRNDTLRTKVMNTSDGYLFVKNAGCRTIEIDSASVSAPFQLAPGQIPIVIGSGFSTYIKVHFTPTVIGLLPVPLTLHSKVITPSDTVIFDTTIVAWGEGLANLEVRNSTAISLISVLPNPAKNGIEIQINSAFSELAEIGIFSMVGTEIYSFKKDLVTGPNSFRLDTQKLSEGTYLIRIKSKEGSDTRIFVKMR
jgi:photosystem II stability/assembly factor-like uncharacterized protein